MITKEFLIEEYIYKQKSQQDIATAVGCHRTTVRHYLKKYRIPLTPPGGQQSLLHGYFACICKGAKKRGIQVSVTQTYLHRLYLQQGQKCTLSGLHLTLKKHSGDYTHTASLDRIDSSKGYIEGNVQWVHKDINMAKQSLSQEQFITMCQQVAQHTPHPPLVGDKEKQ